MSFGLPPVKAKSTSNSDDFAFDQSNYGLPSLMTSGLSTTHAGASSHPLISSELNYHKNRHVMNMVILRNTQGLHAPLKISMELKAAKQIGRLPFLPSSNVMYDSLTGKDLEIGPEDVFNTPEFREIAGQPHAVVEKSLGFSSEDFIRKRLNWTMPLQDFSDVFFCPCNKRDPLRELILKRMRIGQRRQSETLHITMLEEMGFIEGLHLTSGQHVLPQKFSKVPSSVFINTDRLP